VSLRTLVGLPTSTKVEGQGSLAAFGKVGELTYGPLMLTGTYEFNLGPVRPYLGGGIAYIKVLKSSDGAITNLDAESGFGSVFQAGLNMPIDKTWGVFLDLRRLKWNSKATGVVPAAGGAPAQAKLKLTADVVLLGVSKQF
jgi:outer membrane protein